jgi:diaminohydroxyphosphoribosylaminopyrimidine deaminase/5-amino-6-(5-phosphoribosylamino)uracil reductase
MSNADFDREMMAIALMMARRGLGRTAPNPSVGSVIADETTGEIMARAVTAPGGRPHAETQAIAIAGDRARGATIYVTLEPCSHHGHTGPCADAIIAAGLKRCVVAIEDPDPRVAGRGLDRLRAAGIEVVRGAGADEARWVTRGHIVRITERRPLVTLKLALDHAGKVPRGGGGVPLFVTSPEARANGHLLRAENDAILVGSGTVEADNPDLTCRLPGLAGQSPVRVILSRDLSFPVLPRMLETSARVPVWAITAPSADAKRKDALRAAGADVIEVSTVGGALWIPSVMEALVARGITRLLAEGGPKIWRAFAGQSLADEVALYVAGAAHDASADQALTYAARWLGDIPLSLLEERRLGPDVLYLLRTVHPREGS